MTYSEEALVVPRHDGQAGMEREAQRLWGGGAWGLPPSSRPQDLGVSSFRVDTAPC